MKLWLLKAKGYANNKEILTIRQAIEWVDEWEEEKEKLTKKK